MTTQIDTAMVLAAGFGKRLYPITQTIPKPLVSVGGRTMLDRTLDCISACGIKKAVVNVHYLGDQIINHCASKTAPQCIISDERDQILETGGGVVKALPLLGDNPFFVFNADTFWVDLGVCNAKNMLEKFDPSQMDILLMICKPAQATGHSGGADFHMDDNGRLSRTTKDDPKGIIYAGAAIYNPSVFSNAKVTSHSLNIYFDQAISKGRLFGYAMENGHWFTVGTPDGLAAAVQKLEYIEGNY